MTCRVNGRSWVYGKLETPSLKELRERLNAARLPSGKLTVREIVAGAQELHADPSNAGALFQVASQFNLLEMVDQHIIPEDGIGRYEMDPTQGPACAIAAGAGTIYRNYFAPVNGSTGQSKSNQIDCLADLGAALGNAGGRLWSMQNGYALASQAGLTEISARLRASSPGELEVLRQLLRIGLQWNTQVTLGTCDHLVSQAFCSALPVTYSGLDFNLWADFAQLVLEAAYEATLTAAGLNRIGNGNKKVFLTLVGAGAFGNEPDWIIKALRRALYLFKGVDLDIAIVSYGSSKPQVRGLLDQFYRQ